MRFAHVPICLARRGGRPDPLSNQRVPVAFHAARGVLAISGVQIAVLVALALVALQCACNRKDQAKAPWIVALQQTCVDPACTE